MRADVFKAEVNRESLIYDLLHHYTCVMMIQIAQSATSNRPRTKAAHELEVLLDYLKRSRGFDLSGYKRPSLMRRVLKRMQMVRIDSYGDYIDYLEWHPEEYTHLFNTILINFTSFFRDRSVWDYLSNEIVPRIVTGKTANEPIRVWSAGCASGEEAYSLAIVLAETLGVEQFRDRVKIYATDIDDPAINEARQATYTTMKVAGISPILLKKYFDRTANSYTFREDLGCSLIFGLHNLIEDAPISGIDILMCRHVLMYFNTETQKSIMSRFHLAVQDSGFLLLGEADRLYNNTDNFTPVDLKRRIYTKIPMVHLHLSGLCPQELECVSPCDRVECANSDGNRLGEPLLRSLAQTGNRKAVKPLEVGDRSLEVEIEKAQLLLFQEELKTLKQERLALRLELERTQEELLSTNEELQSMNQELQFLTEELRDRNNQVNQLKALLEALQNEKMMLRPCLPLQNHSKNQQRPESSAIISDARGGEGLTA